MLNSCKTSTLTNEVCVQINWVDILFVNFCRMKVAGLETVSKTGKNKISHYIAKFVMWETETIKRTPFSSVWMVGLELHVD